MGNTPKKPENAAFSPRSYRGTVVLNFMGRPTEEFDLYGQAFQEAGQALARTFANNPCRNDLDACPIVFLYRQAVELYLKALLRAGQHLLGLQGETFRFQESILTRHRLSPFLPPLRALFQYLEWSWDPTPENDLSYDEFVAFIEAVDEVDPGSFVFRYPVDKSDASPLPTYFVFDVLDFATKAEAVLELLRYSMYGLEHLIEQTEEYLANCCDEW